MNKKLHDFVDTIDSTDGMKRKKARTANDPELDKAVFTWLVKERQAGISISGPILSVHAQNFHNNLPTDNSSDFIAYKGWLIHFQHCHGINQVKITSEVRSADNDATAEFTLILQTYNHSICC